MTQILRQSTQIIVRIGPAVAVGDGFTPVTSLTLSGADEAELLKANTTTTTDISGATMAAITGCDGWYGLTLTTSHTDTVGCLDVMINDDSLILPIFARFQVIEEALYDAIYTASAAVIPANVTQVLGTAAETPSTAGRLRTENAVIRGNTFGSGSTTANAVLDASASATNDIYNMQTLWNVTTGEARIITDYVGSTKTATVQDAWITAPTNTDKFIITPFGTDPGSLTEVATAVTDRIDAGNCARVELLLSDQAAVQADVDIVKDYVSGTTAMPESYAVDGATVTIHQALYEILQILSENSVSGTTVTVKKRDGTTTARTYTINSSTAPTSITGS